MFKIALCSVFWSKFGIDTKFFDSKLEQIQYFENLAGEKFSDIVNFPFNDGITTVVYFNYTLGSIFDALKQNYAILKFENNGETVYRYYFADIQQDSGTQLKVSLELDDIQTNYFDCREYINNSLINRACISRYIKDGDFYKFNFKTDSYLHSNEFTDTNKRLVLRNPMEFVCDETVNSRFNNYFKTYPCNWVCVFLNKSFIEKDEQTFSVIRGAEFTVNDVKNSYYVLLAPIFKIFNSQSLRLKDTDSTYKEWNSEQLFKFVEENDLSPYVLNIKVYPYVKFPAKAYIDVTDYRVESVGATNYLSFENLSKFNIRFLTKGDNTVVFLTKQDDFPLIFDYQFPFQNIFSADDIKNNINETILSPINYKTTFNELRIVSLNGDSFTYPMNYVNIQNFRFLLNETISPDITKAYIRIEPPTDSIYINNTKNNFTGLCFTYDNSIPYSVSQLENFLANNKNYYLQFGANLKYQNDVFNVNKNFSRVNAGISGFNKAMQNGTLLGGVSEFGLSVVGNEIDVLQKSILNNMNIEKQKIDSSFNIDNLSASPSSYVAADGNILFNLLVQENLLYFYTELYSSLDVDIKKILNYTHLYGYEVNDYGSIKDFDNIRSVFNFVSCNADSIEFPISNLEKQRLIERLKSVRFWRNDGIDYTLNNYERGI